MTVKVKRGTPHETERKGGQSFKLGVQTRVCKSEIIL